MWNLNLFKKTIKNRTKIVLNKKFLIWLILFCYISLCSKLVNEGGGVKNPQNPVNLVYEWPLILNIFQIGPGPYIIPMKFL